MSSISVTDTSQNQAGMFKKQVNFPTSITLSQEKISQIHAEETPATTQLSQEAIDKSQKELLQARKSSIELNESQTNAIENDIDTFFSGMLSHSSVSSLDMGGLISEALQAPEGAGNSTTISMDLSVTQAKLNYLVQKFVPSEHQAESLSEVNQYVAKKVGDQDAILKELTSASLEIARQHGNQDGEKSFEQQLDLINSGQHATQTERNDMLSMTKGTSSSSAWFSDFRQTVKESNDTDFFKSIESAHIDQLENQWQKFTRIVSNFTA